MSQSAKNSTSFDQRISEQLLSMSELIELLTLKIIEIEEKISSIEKESSIIEDEISESTFKTLSASEEKVIHSQNMLNLENDLLDPAADASVHQALGAERKIEELTEASAQMDKCLSSEVCSLEGEKSSDDRKYLEENKEVDSDVVIAFE